MPTVRSTSGKDIKRDELKPGATPILRTIKSKELIGGIKGFIDEHLSGLIRFSNESRAPASAYVNIDVEFFARFLKELLFLVKAKELIYVTFKGDDEYFGAEISFNGIPSISDGDNERLSTLATNAGFDIKFGASITVKTKLFRLSFALVYAVGARKLSKVLENVMFNLHN